VTCLSVGGARPSENERGEAKEEEGSGGGEDGEKVEKVGKEMA
jgi:hypothetical protein